MSDLENELLGLAEDDPHRRKNRAAASSSSKPPKSKAYMEDSDDDGEGEEEMDMDMDEDVDMDLESEEDDGPRPPTVPVPGKSKVRPPAAAASGQGRNPYPLEGKYIDEDDRDELDSMPEIQRENILASRLEEMQKFKDSQQLDMMFKMAGMGGDEGDDDEPSSRKRRKHTSVTKEASRAMKDLKNKRKALDERAQRRALRRERKARSASPASQSQTTEDGEISHRDSLRVGRSPDLSPQQRKPLKKDGEKKEDLDVVPPSCAELNSARLSRYELVDIMFKEGFEEVAVGAFVRLMARETDPTGRPKYRTHRITQIDTSGKHGKYSIEYKGRTVLDNRGLMCQYGKAQRIFRIADVSNGDFDDGEFDRFTMTNRADGVRHPKRSDLRKKHDAIKALRDRPMSNEEINRQVEARRQSNPQAQRSKTVIEITQLFSSRNLAIRRNDHTNADKLERQIISLGGDPTTGQLISMDSGDVAAALGEYHDKIQKINENIKRKTKDQMAAAHLAGIQRKKAEEAIIRSRQVNSNSPAPTLTPKAVVPPVEGLKKGETPQKYVARTVDLDLGDF